jgi:hypothetical protein
LNWPPDTSPFWPLLRMTLRALVVGGCLTLVYKSVDQRDVLTLAIFVLSDGAITSLAKGGKPE